MRHVHGASQTSPSSVWARWYVSYPCALSPRCLCEHGRRDLHSDIHRICHVSQCCAVLATTKCVAQHFLSVQCVGSGATRLKSQTMRWHDKLHLYSAKRAEESAGPHVLKISVYGCTYNKMKTFSHPGGARHFACAHLSWLAARCPLSLFSTVS